MNRQRTDLASPDSAPQTRAGPWRRYALSQQIPFALIMLGIAWLLVATDWLWRVDNVVYDTHQQLWSRPAPDDIVIVAIDELSLSRLGRWPWPRRLHADMIDTLSHAGAKTIVMDIIIAETDLNDPGGDAALGEAMGRHGKVVLPILMEQRVLGGQLIETLPIPPLQKRAGALGHAHIELDADGIARSVYLKEGINTPHWPHLSIATLRLQAPGQWRQLPGARDPTPVPNTSLQQVRDHHVLIPFAGSPGRFQRIAYAQVLDGEFLADTFRDKTVFIGVTATGLGDMLPTPVSGFDQPMSGVEINVNIFDALRQGLIIQPLDPWIRWSLSTVLALIPVFLFPRLSPRGALLSALALLTATLGLSTVLLAKAQLWFPPAAAFAPLLLAYPVWSWRRLEYASRFLTLELQRLRDEPTLISPSTAANLDPVMAFIAGRLPIRGWALYRGNHNVIAQWGDPLPGPPGQVDHITWQQQNRQHYWLTLNTHPRQSILGVHMTGEHAPDAKQTALLLDVVSPLLARPPQRDISAIEAFEARVLAVQEAVTRMQTMRRFINDSVEQMADGVVVCDPLGQVVLANRRAIEYLTPAGAHPPARQLGQPIAQWLANTVVEGHEHWDQLLNDTMLKSRSLQVNAQVDGQRDLLVQIAPLYFHDKPLAGLIFNLSDITRLPDNERERAETLRFLSHDLRAPLISLMALTDISRIKSQSFSQQDLIDRVDHYTRRALTLADDFLHLSMLENTTKLPLTPVDISNLAANAIDAVWDHANGKQISLHDHLPEEPAYVLGDAAVLERMLVNLLSNAIKYSPADTTITVTVTHRDQRIHCCIEDQGYGIPEEDIPNLFDRFYRVRKSEHSKEEGTGLGLAFVKAAVQRHNGEITVRSTLNQGSSFCIALDECDDAD